MKLLNCPVCGYTKVSDNICPNCDADLALIRQLQELSPSILQVTQPEKYQSKIANWQVAVALLLLILGISLGIVSSLLFAQPVLLTKSEPATSPVAISNDNTSASLPPKPIAQYYVTPGDNLTTITERLCGKGTSWQVMVQANPKIQRRANQIVAGEVLQQPNCKD